MDEGRGTRSLERERKWVLEIKIYELIGREK